MCEQRCIGQFVGKKTLFNYTYIYILIERNIQTYVRAYIHTYIPTYLHTHTHTYIYICLVYMYICINTYVHTCICIYLYVILNRYMSHQYSSNSLLLVKTGTSDTASLTSTISIDPCSIQLEETADSTKLGPGRVCAEIYEWQRKLGLTCFP